jgi:hypothetical protein
VSVSGYFVSEGQITQLLTVIVGQAVTKRNGSLLVSGKLNGGYYEALLPAEEKEVKYF